MAQLIVRRLEDDVKDRLARRAKRHGRSTEEEVREILRAAVGSEVPSQGLGTRIASYFKDSGLPGPIEELRGQPARPAEFGNTSRATRHKTKGRRAKAGASN